MTVEYHEIREAIDKKIPYAWEIPTGCAAFVVIFMNIFRTMPEDLILIIPFVGSVFSFLLMIISNRYFRIIERLEIKNGEKNKSYRVETCVSILRNKDKLKKWNVKYPGKVFDDLDKAKELFNELTIKDEFTVNQVGKIYKSATPPSFNLKWSEANIITEMFVDYKVGALLYLLPLFFILMSYAETTKKTGISMFVIFLILAGVFGLVKLIQYIDIKLSKRYLRIVELNSVCGGNCIKELKIQSYITKKKIDWVKRNQEKIAWKDIEINSLKSNAFRDDNADLEYLENILTDVSSVSGYVDRKIN